MNQVIHAVPKWRINLTCKNLIFEGILESVSKQTKIIDFSGVKITFFW